MGAEGHAAPGRAQPSWAARVADVGLGLSVASWGVAGLLRIGLGERPSVPRLVLCGLQLAVGALLLRRGPLVAPASRQDLAAALPSFLLGGLAVSLAHPLDGWPLVAQALFAAGGVGAVACLTTLGRAFAILPGARGVVARGPYALVRHPAYACELLMVAACCLAAGLPWGLAVGLASVPAMALRIWAEERALLRLEAYRDYAGRVRWRLLPGVL